MYTVCRAAPSPYSREALSLWKPLLLACSPQSWAKASVQHASLLTLHPYSSFWPPTVALWWRRSILSFFARIIERALDPKTLIRLADGLDVVPMLVSHFDSCFTIRRLIYGNLYPPNFQDCCYEETSSKYQRAKEFSFCYYLKNEVKKGLRKSFKGSPQALNDHFCPELIMRNINIALSNRIFDHIQL